MSANQSARLKFCISLDQIDTLSSGDAFRLSQTLGNLIDGHTDGGDQFTELLIPFLRLCQKSVMQREVSDLCDLSAKIQVTQDIDGYSGGGMQQLCLDAKQILKGISNS